MGRKLLVITGASGFVGRMLVPYLTISSSSHLLVGRDQQKLAQLFPALLRTDYDGFPARGRGFDVLIHLAAINNSSKVPAEEFRAGNVTLLADVIASARHAGVPNL
ncbi:MAG: NAD-dependent epimerase/dehydratase family protein, partial [Roseicyclus sp.]|uniref:NAD-dependent epimerase/dehydratase family protein n=1 Tax=Roseicyclus sp. TaxID=1914329 RepID=UPI003BAEE52D